MDSFRSLLETIDPEDYMNWLGVDYKLTRGRSGTQINIKECPRCGTAKWKVYMNAESGVGNCFSGDCADHPGLNLVSFTQNYEGSDFKATAQTIKRYVEQSGWTPPRPKVEMPEASVDGVTLPKSVPAFQSEAGKSYLEGRGYSQSIIESLDMGYADTGGYDYVSWDGEQRVQDYSRRIIIPIKDMFGKVVTFQGRDTTGHANERYKFPPGLASTSAYLYNLNACQGHKHIIICEGVFDAVGIMNAVGNAIGVTASFGMHLSGSINTGENDQISALVYAQRNWGLKSVIFMWDGDSKSVKEAIKASLLITQLGLDARVAILNDGKDPGEASKAEILKALKASTKITKSSALRLLMQIKMGRALPS